MQRLVQLGALAQLQIEPKVICPFFVVRQKKKRRLVTDHREGNKLISDETYVQYEDLSVIQRHVLSTDLLSSIDIKSAYYGVSLHEDFIPYCAIQVDHVLHFWTVLSLGISTAPRIYTSVTAQVVQLLRSKGIRVFRYIDDFLILAHASIAAAHIDLAVTTLKEWGFIINSEKSILQPTPTIRHLGLLLDAPSQGFLIPSDKMTDLRNFAHSALTKGTLRRKSCQKLIGRILSVTKALSVSRRLAWPLITDLYSTQDHRITLTAQTLRDLAWLRDNLPAIGRRSMTLPVMQLLMTDSSLQGWGAFLASTQQCAAGVWSEELSRRHIQELEMLAVILAIEALCPVGPICLLTDNSSVVAYVSRQGGRKNPALQLMTFHLWNVTVQSPIEAVVWIPSGINLIADGLSRGKHFAPAEITRLWRSMTEHMQIGPTGWIDAASLDHLSP